MPIDLHILDKYKNKIFADIFESLIGAIRYDSDSIEITK